MAPDVTATADGRYRPFRQGAFVKDDRLADHLDSPVRAAAMIENQKIRAMAVIGPLGEALTLDTLPPAHTRRWVARRKAEVVAAVQGGLLSVDDACERYGLTVEELISWQRALDRSGMQGLRVTRLQHYRDLWERQGRY